MNRLKKIRCKGCLFILGFGVSAVAMDKPRYVVTDVRALILIAEDRHLVVSDVDWGALGKQLEEMVCRERVFRLPGSNAFGYAAVYDNGEVFHALLSIKGIPVDHIDHKDAYGLTPLMRAAQFGYGSRVKMLLEYGADPNLLDNDGKNALDHARQDSHDDCVELLKSALKESVPKAFELGNPAHDALTAANLDLHKRSFVLMPQISAGERMAEDVTIAEESSGDGLCIIL